MKTVTHVITTICRGGAENQLLILCAEQIKMGIEVKVIPLKGAPELLDEFLGLGVTVDLSLLGKNFLTQLLFITSKRMKSDIWHAHLPQAELLLAFIRKSQVVVSRHYGGKFYPSAPNFLSMFLSRIATRRASQIIAISDSVAMYLENSREVSQHKVVNVVRYGFDESAFNSIIDADDIKMIKTERFLKFGTLARLSPEKDLETMIRGFSEFSKRISDKPTLEIYGDGSERHKLSKLINDLKLDQQVFLMGRTAQVAKTLRGLDCFILSSRFEGFGMVLLEAMATDLPIVCSRIPAALEVLGEDGAATYFATGNPTDLSLALNEIENLNQQIRHTQQQLRLKLFGAREMAESIMEIYRIALGAQANSPTI
jgi:glycosyltransferase involved in cell wall biosynthesis